MASLSVEEENYVRIHLLLTGISPRAVRILFDKEFAPACLDATIKKEYNKLLDLKKTHRINQSQWNLLFPRFPDLPDSKEFDVTLITTLLRHLTPMIPPLCGFDRLPSAIETTQAADLARIKHYRNYLAHLEDSKTDTAYFNTAWADITGAIGRLGGQQMKQECYNLKTKPLPVHQTIQEIMIDIKRSNNDIRKYHEVLLEQCHKEMTSQQDTVPWNIRDLVTLNEACGQ
ncbi:E3 ubiquitin-protein ligase DZIP3-like [Mytilus galloprovincialis]|uniref:E3 ubiquitin-protein ligase DZIP3-like n=1 Tax=Mytilus galloprovincialis TaxID=29158 RepID=UPI003F7BD525